MSLRYAPNLKVPKAEKPPVIYATASQIEQFHKWIAERFGCLASEPNMLVDLRDGRGDLVYGMDVAVAMPPLPQVSG